MNESALIFDNPAIQESFVSSFTLLPHEIESRFYSYVPFAEDPAASTHKSCNIFSSQTDGCRKPKLQRQKIESRDFTHHSGWSDPPPHNLKQSTQPWSNLPPKKHSKNQRRRRPKNRARNRNSKQRSEWSGLMDRSTHHDDRAVDRIPSDATAETPWCCCYWKSTKSILEASAKPNPNPNQWGTVSEP